MRTFFRILAVLCMVFILGWQGSGYAKTNSLVILDDKREVDFTESAMALISTQCGEIYHVFRSEALMGYIPKDKVNLLLGRAGILEIYQSQTQPDRADPIVNCAIKAFNALLQPVRELAEEEIREMWLGQLKEGRGSRNSWADLLGR